MTKEKAEEILTSKGYKGLRFNFETEDDGFYFDYEIEGRIYTVFIDKEGRDLSCPV